MYNHRQNLTSGVARHDGHQQNGQNPQFERPMQSRNTSSSGQMLNVEPIRYMGNSRHFHHVSIDDVANLLETRARAEGTTVYTQLDKVKLHLDSRRRAELERFNRLPRYNHPTPYAHPSLLNTTLPSNFSVTNQRNDFNTTWTNNPGSSSNYGTSLAPNVTQSRQWSYNQQGSSHYHNHSQQAQREFSNRKMKNHKRNGRRSQTSRQASHDVHDQPIEFSSYNPDYPDHQIDTSFALNGEMAGCSCFEPV